MVEANKKQQQTPINSLLSIEITGRKQAEGTWFFLVKLTRRHDQINMSIEKRYSQFSDLHALLTGQGYADLPKLPSKKYFMSSTDMDNRQKGLEKLLRLLSERPDTCNSQAFCQFL